MKNIKLFLSAFALLLLISCSSTRKSKSKTTELTQTSTTKNTQASSVKATNATDIDKKENSFKNESGITISFDEDQETDNGFVVDPGFNFNPTTETENDYAGAPPKKPTVQKIYNYEIGGQKITSPLPIKKINLYDKTTGKTTELKVNQLNTTDSSSTQTQTATQTTSVKTNTQTSKTKSSAGWLWILGGCVVIGLILYIWFAIFKRRKNK